MHRVGILVDSVTISAQFLDLIRRLQARGDEPIIIVQNLEGPAQPAAWRRAANLFRPAKLASLAQRLAWRLYEGSERRALGPAHEAISQFGIPEELRIIQTTPSLSKSGLVVRHREEDLAALRELDFAILLRGGSNILRGAILGVATHGILSLHHGDNRVNRGGPAGFWEVYHCWPTTGYIVQRLTDELDGGFVLRRGNRPTAPTYLANLASIIAASTDDFAEVIALVLDQKPPRAERIVSYGGQIFKSPSFLQVLRMLLRKGQMSAVKLVDRLLARESHWQVGLSPEPWPTLNLRKAINLPETPGAFLADPFVVEREGRTIIFAEQFRYREGRGTIAAFEVIGNGVQRLGVVLKEPFHLSFPYLLESDGELFMVPETEQSGDIRLYRCLSFPNQWEFDSVLVPNLRALDCMPFEFNGTWWMIVGQSTAHAFGVRPLLYRASALRGPWARCLDGPISAEIEHARNGGLLRDGDALYRVIQMPDFGKYGAWIRIAHVDQVSELAYNETSVYALRPAHRPGVLGGHHLHNSANWTVFDFWERRSMRGWPWLKRKTVA